MKHERHPFLTLATALLACGFACTTTPEEREEAAYGEDPFESGADRPPSISTLRSMARILASKGQDSEAETVFNKLIEEYPRFTPAYNELAELYMRHGMTDNAIAALERGLEMRPGDPVLSNNLGMCRIVQRDYTAAVDDFQAAIERDPSDVRTRANLAFALGLTGRLDESRSLYAQILPPEEVIHNQHVLRDARRRLGLDVALADWRTSAETGGDEPALPAADALQVADAGEPHSRWRELEQREPETDPRTAAAPEAPAAAQPTPPAIETQSEPRVEEEELEPSPWTAPETTVLIAKPEPAQVAEPEPVQVTEPEPVQVTEPEPVQIAEPEPVQIAEPEPVQVTEPEPVQVTEPEPVQIAEPEPAQITEPEPAQIAEPEPVQVTEPEPVQVTEPEPVQIAEPEPAQITEPEPAQITEPEPAQITEPEPAQITEPEPAQIAEPEPAQIAEPEPAATGNTTPWTAPEKVQLLVPEPAPLALAEPDPEPLTVQPVALGPPTPEPETRPAPPPVWPTITWRGLERDRLAVHGAIAVQKLDHVEVSILARGGRRVLVYEHGGKSAWVFAAGVDVLVNPGGYAVFDGEGELKLHLGDVEQHTPREGRAAIADL